MELLLRELIEALHKYDLHRGSLESVFEKTVGIFQKLAADSQTKSSEKNYVQEFLQKISTQIEPRINAVSIPEELLVKALDNPIYFNEDEWTSAQRAKEEIVESFRKLLPLFLEKSTAADKAPSKKPDKSKWMKS